MNRVRQLCATTLLTLVLAASPALAGDMPGGFISQPPCIATSSPTPTEAETADDPTQCLTPAIDPATKLALSLLQSVLSIF